MHPVHTDLLYYGHCLVLALNCVASVLLSSHTHIPITLLPVLQAHIGYEALASFGRVVELERRRLLANPCHMAMYVDI